MTIWDLDVFIEFSFVNKRKVFNVYFLVYPPRSTLFKEKKKVQNGQYN